MPARKKVDEITRRSAYQLYMGGRMTQKRIAEVLGISQPMVSMILIDLHGMPKGKQMKKPKPIEDDISDEIAATILTASDFNEPSDERHDTLNKAFCQDASVWHSMLSSPQIGAA